MRHLMVVPLLALLLIGCGKQIHPGAVDPLDSRAYDTLLIMQAALDEAKAQVTSGKLPASASPTINKAGLVYEAGRLAQRTYHSATAAARPAAATTLNNELAKVGASLTTLQSLTRGVK